MRDIMILHIKYLQVHLNKYHLYKQSNNNVINELASHLLT